MRRTNSIYINPGQWRALVDNPGLVPNAVEETLRTSRRAGGAMVRYARTDFDIDGVAIKAGDLVLMEIGGGNHDPTVFANPDRVDITRHAATHLAFGYGARYCIGAPLARIELQTVLSQLVSRFPTLKLAADVEDLAVRDDALTLGVDRTSGAVVTPIPRLRRLRGVKRFGRVLDTPQRFVDSAIYLAPSGKEHLGRSIM